MLSYKLKHLCSRLIASLSAVGLVSIAGEHDAVAATYKPGATVTVNFVNSNTYTAEYADDGKIRCTEPSSTNHIAAVVSGTYVSGTDTYEACTYILDEGYAVYATTGTCIASGENTFYGSGATCTPATYSGATISGILLGGTGASNVKLVDQVTDYYNDNSGSISKYAHVVSVIASGDASEGDITESIIKPIEVRVTFSCGTHGSANVSDSTYTGFGYVLYDTTFTMPSAANCIPDEGYTLEGWSSSL